MRKIILWYIIAILACVFFGVVVALANCYSRWYFVLFVAPLWLGWQSLSMMSRDINQHLEWATVFVFVSFISLVVALILWAVNIDGKSFWGIVYACSCFTAIIGTMVVMLRIHLQWMSRNL